MNRTVIVATIFVLGFWSRMGQAGDDPTDSPENCKYNIVLEAGDAQAMEVLNRYRGSDFTFSEFEKQKAFQREVIRQAMAIPSRVGAALKEKLLVEHLKKYSKYRDTVSILIGSPVNTHAEVEKSVELVKKYVELGFFVFYDADSILGPQIKALVGTNGLGITGNSNRQGEGTQFISNPYFRYSIFSKSDRVVSGLASIAGQGLLLQGKVTHVWDPTETWEYWHGKWDWIQKPNLGLKFIGRPTVIGAEIPVKPKYFSTNDPIPAFDPNALLEEMFTFSLSEVIYYGSTLVYGQAAQEQVPSGAVVFGAKENHPDFTDLVYSTSRYLAAKGIPIATGGSAGYMLVANSAAWDVGADSIGIPYGAVHSDKNSLKGESRTYLERHSLTLPSNGYDSRIPLLLYRRPLIINVPGGGGTMREIAVAFMQMAVSPQINHQLVLVSSDYYGPMMEGLMKAPFHQEFKAAIHLVNNPEELGPVVEKVEAQLGGAVSSFRLTTPLTPRNENTNFEPPQENQQGGKPWRKKRKRKRH